MNSSRSQRSAAGSERWCDLHEHLPRGVARSIQGLHDFQPFTAIAKGDSELRVPETISGLAFSMGRIQGCGLLAWGCLG